MNTNKIFLRILSLLVLAVVSTASWAVAPKPNIILINVDDLGWSDLGCYGSDYYETKHIDQLAREGVRFTKAYAAAAICSPTRAALLTGKYPARVGITDWIRAEFQGGVVPASGKSPTEYVTQAGKSLKTPPNPLFLELNETTSAEYLQKQGYITCHVGKWHLGPAQWYPTSQGFKINIAGSDLGQPPSYFDPYVNNNKGKRYNIPTLAPRQEGEFLTDRLGDEVVAFVQKNAGKPFFISWNPYAVHTPIQGKKEYIEKYRQKQGGNHKNPVYAALIQSLDDNVGKLVRCLDSLKLTQNTLLIFTSDNGGLLPITSNLPLRSGKGYPYEGGLRVPLIVKWPGVAKAGTLIDEPVITMDVFATVMDAAGIGKTSSDGFSLRPLFRQANQRFSRNLYWHFPHYREADVVPYSIIRSGNYKLIKYYDGTKNEFYDLVKDPTEKNNLYESRTKEANRLETNLCNWLKKVNAKMPENTTARRQ